jgi:hypothetical protein
MPHNEPSNRGVWRLTNRDRARDQRAHWFETKQDAESICKMVAVGSGMPVFKDIIAVADAGVLTCGLCRHMLAAQEEIRALRPRSRGGRSR